MWQYVPLNHHTTLYWSVSRPPSAINSMGSLNSPIYNYEYSRWSADMRDLDKWPKVRITNVICKRLKPSTDFVASRRILYTWQSLQMIRYNEKQYGMIINGNSDNSEAIKSYCYREIWKQNYSTLCWIKYIKISLRYEYFKNQFRPFIMKNYFTL